MFKNSKPVLCVLLSLATLVSAVRDTQDPVAQEHNSNFVFDASIIAKLDEPILNMSSASYHVKIHLDNQSECFRSELLVDIDNIPTWCGMLRPCYVLHLKSCGTPQDVVDIH